MNKPGCHRTGLDAHFGVDTSVLRNTSRNWPGIGGADAAPEPLALLVDNADRGRLLRYVQPNIMRHRNLDGANHRATCPDRGTIDAYGFEPRLPEVHTIKVTNCNTKPIHDSPAGNRPAGHIDPSAHPQSLDTPPDAPLRP